MPAGHKPPTKFRCRKCDNVSFTTITDLRKHQWSTHREAFAKLMEAGKLANNKKLKGRRSKGSSRWSKAQMAKYKSTMALRKQQEVYLNGTQNLMSAAQLLDKLKNQRNFMNDVVNLVEGIIKQ